MPVTIVLSLSVARSTLDDIQFLEQEFGDQFVYDEVYKPTALFMDKLVQKAVKSVS